MLPVVADEGKKKVMVRSPGATAAGYFRPLYGPITRTVYHDEAVFKYAL